MKDHSRHRYYLDGEPFAAHKQHQHFSLSHWYKCISIAEIFKDCVN